MRSLQNKRRTRGGPAEGNVHMPGPFPERDHTGTALHEERLDAVVATLLGSGARTVLDLGCGTGGLLRRLVAEEQFSSVVGIDTSAEALRDAESSLLVTGNCGPTAWSLEHASFTQLDERWAGFDAAAMVETLEHVAPEHLSRVERSVFAVARPGIVVMTTPNREYNELYGMAKEDFRHADHKFEWSRAKFRAWAENLAARNGYRVMCEDVGRADPLLGSPTQMGVFRRL